MIFECPGSKEFKHPQPEMIKCPFCGGEVEIWTDEFHAVCEKCGNSVGREKGQSCLDWCKYAKECVGEDVYNRYMDNKVGKKTKKGD